MRKLTELGLSPGTIQRLGLLEIATAGELKKRIVRTGQLIDYKSLMKLSDTEMESLISQLENLEEEPAPVSPEPRIENRIALIDLDGTIADYDAAHSAAQRLLQSPNEPPYQDRFHGGIEPAHITARRKMIQAQTGFWETLNVIPLGMEVVDLLRSTGFGLHVLTKGPMGTPSAWTEKVQWCKKHLPDAMVTVGSDKSLVFGRILLDDWPEYFNKWLLVRPRGLVICLAHPWNAQYAVGTPQCRPDVFRYDGQNKDQLKSVIDAAYARSSGP